MIALLAFAAHLLATCVLAARTMPASPPPPYHYYPYATYHFLYSFV